MNYRNKVMHEAHPTEVKVEVVLHLIYQGLWFGIMLNDKKWYHSNEHSYCKSTNDIHISILC